MARKYYLGIDVGGTLVKYALMDETGNLVEQGTRPSPQAGFDATKEELAAGREAFKALLTELYQDYAQKISGIALSCPGKVDSQEGVIYFGGILRYLHEFPAKSFLEDLSGLPVALVNDGKAAALAEYWKGGLAGTTNGAVMILGTGLGGGLILNGQLYQGSNFLAGELSLLHLQDEDLSEESGVGFKYSPVRMVKTIAERLGLEDLTDGPTVFEAINRRDERAWPLFETFCRQIALVIYNQQALLDLERVVIGGGISAQPIVVEEIQNQYQFILKSMGNIGDILDSVTIASCQYRGTSNLVGALYQLLVAQGEV